MTKKIQYALIIFILVFASSAVYADKIFVLYGFKIGQKSEAPVKQFGKPLKTHTFEDGYSYKLYQMKDHIVVFESDNTRPDLIWAIQIQGKSNPPFHGLYDINLGDEIAKVIKTFGKPDSIKPAIDEETKEVMKNIEFYSYEKSGNFSIEATDGKVSSIKISFNGPVETKESTVDFTAFLKTVRSKDLNKISHYVYSDFEYFNKKSFLVITSIIDALKNSNKINDIFFNQDYGIVSIQEKDIVHSALRVQSDPGSMGYVFRIKKNNS